MVVKKGKNIDEGLGLPGIQRYTHQASPFKRILAFVLDLLIIDLFLFSFFSSLFERSIGNMGFFEILGYSGLTKAIFILSFFMSMLMLAYFTVFEFMLGQTPGKMIFNLKIRSDDEITIFEAIARNLWTLPIFPMILLWILDPLFMFIRKDHRRLSEIITRTSTQETFHYYGVNNIKV